MIDLEVLEGNLKNNKLDNCYIFAGLDEMLIKESIENIVNVAIDETFKDLNVIKLDGVSTTSEDIMNACETLPFMSDKKVVIIYRANFLKEKTDSVGIKLYSKCTEYIKNTPSHCILVLYYLFNDKRESLMKNKKLMSLDKSCALIKTDKLRGEKLYRKVNNIFEKKGKSIGKVELKFFCDSVENNFDIIEREIEKVISYTEGRDITRKDITLMLPSKGEDDVFDLVDYLSQKRPEKAIDLINELLNKGENMMLILSLIESQFSMLYKIKVGINEGKTKEDFVREIKRPAFVCEKLMGQSKKFSFKQLQQCMKLCVETEKRLKSTGFDKKTEMELMLIDTVRV